jgi:hypothetical protein
VLQTLISPFASTVSSTLVAGPGSVAGSAAEQPAASATAATALAATRAITGAPGRQ